MYGCTTEPVVGVQTQPTLNNVHVYVHVQGMSPDVCLQKLWFGALEF